MSMAQIVSDECVPVPAMRFQALECCYGMPRNNAPPVFLRRNRFKMSRIPACLHSAQVVNLKSVRDRANQQRIRQPMNLVFVSVHVDARVSAMPRWLVDYPALARNATQAQQAAKRGLWRWRAKWSIIQRNGFHVSYVTGVHASVFMLLPPRCPSKSGRRGRESRGRPQPSPRPHAPPRSAALGRRRRGWSRGWERGCAGCRGCSHGLQRSRGSPEAAREVVFRFGSHRSSRGCPTGSLPWR